MATEPRSTLVDRRRALALRAREMEILVELQDDHGYSFMEVTPGQDRVSMKFTRRTGSRKMNLSICRVLRVAVPTTSELAKRTGDPTGSGRDLEVKAKPTKKRGG